MDFPCRFGMLLLSLLSVAGIRTTDGAVNHLSKEDVLLLKDEQNPKCFTRTLEDFTCFFETADNRTYDLFYRVNGDERCEMSVRVTEEGTFLHICSFPELDVCLFVETHLKVVERDADTIHYQRELSVEDHILLNPPFDVSLHPNGRAGQLQVSWKTKVPEYQEDNVMYRIRFSSNGLGEKIKEAKEGDVLDSLVPGEEVQVQVSVKCAYNSSTGHWSGWSRAARAVVPQSAEDISLLCFTSDLQNILCQWDGSRYGKEKEYKVFYKTDVGDSAGWTEWTECLADRLSADRCSFPGEEFRRVRVQISSARAALTFYTEEFTLNQCIKTSPPSHLRRSFQKDKLCLEWQAPLPSLSAHLRYEVGYQIRGGETWMTVSLMGPLNATCLEVPTGVPYNVKIRAKPTGSVYWGDWSDWSHVVTGDAPTHAGTLLMLSIPVFILIAAIILIWLFPRYLSKLKLCIWQPVPNLDKVLQGYLTEFNGQKWNPPITAKQSPEDAPSVVEIMTEDEASGLGTPSEIIAKLLPPEKSLSSRERVDGSPGTEVFPDYVALNKDSVILHPKVNKYVDEYEAKMGDEGVKGDLFQTCLCSCTADSASTPPYLDVSFLNTSYLPLAEAADKFDGEVPAGKRPGNLYTNLPRS